MPPASAINSTTFFARLSAAASSAGTQSSDATSILIRGRVMPDTLQGSMTSAAAELIGAMLGTLFLTLGVAAAVAATLRAERRDRALLWFGVATALYGLRLIVRSEAVREVLPDASWLRVEHFITYIIIVPGALLAESALPTASRGVLRFMWRANLAAAAVALAWDLSASRSGAAMPLNQAAVVANITILLV